jgi:integrase
MTKAIHKRELTPRLLQTLKPQAHGFLIWDEKQGGLALSVRPSGHMAWKAIYNYHGRTRWYTIGNLQKIGLSQARDLAKNIMARVSLGQDPQGDKKEAARRKPITFDTLAARYVDEHARKKNKSWKQADYLVRQHLLPRWKNKDVNAISREDVEAMMGEIKAPVVANQTLAAASAIFSWGIKKKIGGLRENPCYRVDRNEVKSRERTLSESELPRFWSAFDDAGLITSTALKLILLTGQRPGEVGHMRHEHIRDGWWEMPGGPDPASNWPGTKNGESHRVWLSAPVQALLSALEDDRSTGSVFGVRRLDVAMRQICTKLGIKDKVTPHDLRRTNGTMITGLGLGRDAMNRVQNHKEGGIGDVYDRHKYAEENKRVMEAVAAHIMRLATGKGADDKVVPLRKGAP